MDKTQIRQTILKEAIMLAPFEGWSEPMLKRATARAGLDESAYIRCFQTVNEAISFWSEEADAAMEQYASTLALSEMKIRERIAALVLFRLHYFLPHREALRRALHHLWMPWNSLLSLQLTKNTVDRMWRLAGDASHDYNWYTKRLLLAGVYSATLLFWLNDQSEHCIDTNIFLQRRLEEVLKLGGAFSRFVKRAA